jgi:hypothetical protein
MKILHKNNQSSATSMQNITFRKPVYVFIILGTISSAFFWGDDPLTKIIAGFNKYVTELPQEKIYVHFDRPNYTSGEIIWYKAYLTAGVDHVPSGLSLTVYTELINDAGKIIQQQKLLALNGSVAGNFTLPDSIPSGNYMFRAYTNWMKNSGSDYFFHRLIKIWGTETVATTISPTIHKEDQIDFKLFPEGGNLVESIPGRVAFKAIGTDGLGRSVAGKILANNEVVGEFKSNVLGMGVFILTPQSGKQYTIKLDQLGLEVPFPTIQKSGVVMTVTQPAKQDNLTVRIFSNQENLKVIYVLAQTRGVVGYSARIDLTTPVAVIKIPKQNLLSGIAQITITDAVGIPLAERLVFVNHEDALQVLVKPNKTIYTPRELVVLDIQAHDANGKPVVADLSLAVCDDQQVLRDPHAETFRSYLLLTSELRGYIESPGYYFNPENKDRDEALDNLLLTQGWRRFTISQAQQEKWDAPRHKIEQGLTIKGQLVDKYTSKPVEGGKVNYLITQPFPDSKIVTTSTIGDFEFNHVIYFDSTQAILKAETKRGGKGVTIRIDKKSEYFPMPYPISVLKQSQREFEKTFILKSLERRNIDRAFQFDSNAVALQDIEITARKETPTARNFRTYGPGTASIKVAGNPGMEFLQHPLQLVQGQVAGVQVIGSGQDWSVKIRGVNSIQSGTAPLIMVDDIILDSSVLNSLSVRDIESFTVWKGADAAIFGARGTNGVIGFYTKRGGFYESPKSTGLTHPAMGYQIEREFYAPQYDVQKSEHVKPDKRVTLFWAPRILTDSTGRATLSFYNHDEETSILGILEGHSMSGNAGTIQFGYSIRKE